MTTINEAIVYDHSTAVVITEKSVQDGMFFWTHDGERYRTNSNGEGMFRKDENRENWRQVLGLSQFSVLGIRRSDAWRKIRNTMNQ